MAPNATCGDRGRSVAGSMIALTARLTVPSPPAAMIASWPAASPAAIARLASATEFGAANCASGRSRRIADCAAGHRLAAAPPFERGFTRTSMRRPPSHQAKRREPPNLRC